MATCNAVIDLSHNNSTVDFQRARADGILGIIHKATQGTGFIDRAYAQRRQAAKAAGLLWGAYHFGTAADPVAQAKFFLRTASPGANDLMVLDFENNPRNPGNTMSLDQAHSFIAAVKDASGITPGLYGGRYLQEQLGNATDSLLQNCWLWWSQYSPAPEIPRNWPTWTLWQYTDGHNGHAPRAVDGVGPCDRDQYQGAMEELRAKWASGTLL